MMITTSIDCPSYQQWGFPDLPKDNLKPEPQLQLQRILVSREPLCIGPILRERRDRGVLGCFGQSDDILHTRNTGHDD